MKQKHKIRTNKRGQNSRLLAFMVRLVLALMVQHFSMFAVVVRFAFCPAAFIKALRHTCVAA